ncbi:MAG: maleylacetoacetate isomerase [Leptothrix sp. (in: b-proteobacteria)]
MQLHNHSRSSTSFRVRIALAMKGLSFDYLPVQIARNEQHQPEFAARSPARLVPLLVQGEQTLSQSLAILEYLDEIQPLPPLLPADALGRARVRSLALDIACEIQPLTNLRVLRYLVKDLGASEDSKNDWYRHWVETGLQAVEQRLASEAATGVYCHGDQPGLADCVLVPQVFIAQRFECRLDALPNVMRVFDACMALAAFRVASPPECPDAEA